ncbi:protein CBFA2T1-like [Oppia nitens]|uniref:protein CBFA2T1-like n=1 Tax=Oppia nitens TaxID=1686743 RepID=UPI0023D9C048|nr:protein CBFA2T1-like [Oppia nitens]
MNLYREMPVWKKDLVRSIAFTSNLMPTSPSEVKISQKSTSTPPPPQPSIIQINNNFPNSGLSTKNSSVNGGSHSPSNNSHITSNSSDSPSPPSATNMTSRSHLNQSDSNVRQITKLKRFLTTLYQFANEISHEVGDRVKQLIFALINGTISTEEFHQKIQEITNYPLRPYVIPFLKLHLPILQTEIVHFARVAKTNPSQYLREHESLILDSSAQLTALSAGEPFEIFQRNDTQKDNQTNKRRQSPDILIKENGFNESAADRESGPPPPKRHQSIISPTIGTRLSPAGLAPLLLHTSGHHHSHHITNPSILHSHLSTSSRSIYDETTSSSAPALYHNNNNNRENAINGRNHSLHVSGDHSNDRFSYERDYRPVAGMYSQMHREYSEDRDMEEEWKNINTMLNCILGMVEKTKRALSILQHRSDSRNTDYNHWSVPALRGRHYNTLDVSNHSSHSHDFHDIKKQRIDGIVSNHFPKTAISEMDRIADIRRVPNSHKQLEEAVNEVKRQAVVELQKAVSAAETKASELVATERIKMEKLVSDARRQAADEALSAITRQDDSTENCWNCGRKASETCSGCNSARYCGSFCQHKDWENHHRVCQQNTTTNGLNGSQTLSSTSDNKMSKSPTPASNASNSSANIVVKSSASALTVGAGDVRDNNKIIKNE